MATIELTAKNFDDVVQNNNIVIIDFWADWCGPCKSFGPVFEAASEQFADVVFAKLDTEAESDLASQFQIRSIPYLMVFREQVIIYKDAGAVSAKRLEALIEGVRSLNMEQIKQRLNDDKKK